jgi:hypothetical protein
MSFQMKTHIHLSSIFPSASLLAACASTSSVPDVALSPEHIASLMAINDNLMLPGERIGPVFLGMTGVQA